MRRHTAKRSRPKADIEPIRVSELLNGAGMRGFLSVLEPPVAVPHLREFAVPVSAYHSPELVEWLSARSEALLRQLGGQQEALAAIAEVARRTNGGAERLSRLAQVYPVENDSPCRIVGGVSFERRGIHEEGSRHPRAA